MKPRGLAVIVIVCAGMSVVLAQPGPSPDPGQAGSAAAAGSGSGSGSAGSGSAGSGSAAETKGTPEVDELRPPTSPAFSLLGVAPTEIDRPRTPSALMASIGSAFASTLPSSLALEFAPYWFADHSTLSLEEFSKGGGKAWFTRMLSSVGINVATNKATLPIGLGGGEYTDLSTGIYVVPVRSWDSKACDELKNGPQLIDDELAKAKVAAAKLLTTAVEACHGNSECEAKATREFSDVVSKLSAPKLEAQATIEADHKKKIEACEKVFWTPSGLVVSAAFATVERFNDSKWSEGVYLRTALWTNIGYEGERVSFLLLGRLQWESTGNDGIKPDLLDIGGRFILHRKSFAGSIEGVYRSAALSDLEDGWRLALVGEVPLGGSWLSVSIGKDYDSTEDASFFALANVSVTMGDPQLKDPDAK